MPASVLPAYLFLVGAGVRGPGIQRFYLRAISKPVRFLLT